MIVTLLPGTATPPPPPLSSLEVLLQTVVFYAQSSGKFMSLSNLVLNSNSFNSFSVLMQQFSNISFNGKVTIIRERYFAWSRGKNKIWFLFLLVCLRDRSPSKFIYEGFTNYINTCDFVYDLFTKFRTLIIYLLYIYEVVNVQRFTKNLLKFVYFVYEPSPKIWSEFVYGWFTTSLRNNFDVRLPRFVYQNLVNEQPCLFRCFV